MRVFICDSRQHGSKKNLLILHVSLNMLLTPVLIHLFWWKILLNHKVVTNYDICFICQEENNSRLICPANSKRSDKNVGYRSLASPQGIREKRNITDRHKE